MNLDATTQAPFVVAGVEAEQILLLAMARLRMSRPAEDFFRKWPNARAAAIRLAWLVTSRPVYPVTGRPILDHCLEESMRAAMKSSKASCDHSHIYMATLITKLSMLLEIQIVDAHGRWDPTLDAPLEEWLVKHPFAAIEPYSMRTSPLPVPSQYRSALYQRLLEPADITAVQTLHTEAKAA